MTSRQNKGRLDSLKAGSYLLKAPPHKVANIFFYFWVVSWSFAFGTSFLPSEESLVIRPVLALIATFSMGMWFGIGYGVANVNTTEVEPLKDNDVERTSNVSK